MSYKLKIALLRHENRKIVPNLDRKTVQIILLLVKTFISIIFIDFFISRLSMCNLFCLLQRSDGLGHLRGGRRPGNGSGNKGGLAKAAPLFSLFPQESFSIPILSEICTLYRAAGVFERLYFGRPGLYPGAPVGCRMGTGLCG